MDDPWRLWLYDPPWREGHKRVEYVRPKLSEEPDDCEGTVIEVDKQRPEWNIAGVYWRPFY